MDLYLHQQLALDKLQTGSILVGEVGSGKSRTALAYYNKYQANKDLYIITTAKKRDTKEWEEECEPFGLKVPVVIDSWNNIKKYEKVKKAFFIFDEQRVVGAGTWAKTFIHIAKNNDWILLSATPGDTWSDYIPVFIANGFYKNRSEFIRQHVVYKPFMNFPVIDYYVNTKVLEKHRDDILVKMKFVKNAVKHDKAILCDYNKDLYFKVLKDRWNVYKDWPIINSAELSQCLRRIVNSDKSRLDKLVELIKIKLGVIVFYNFDYELDMIKERLEEEKIFYTQCNGHKHEKVPDVKNQCWAYLVQYMAGAEGWNCIATDTIIFYSLNHSYKMMTQAAGRIDRLNTPFENLYYYKLLSSSNIDKSIKRCLSEKRDFNENKYEEDYDEFEKDYENC